MSVLSRHLWGSLFVAGAVICFSPKDAHACHCVAPNKNSEYICDSYCTTDEIKDLLGANIKQGYVIDGSTDIKRIGDVADEAERIKGADAECDKSSGDYTCKRDLAAVLGSYGNAGKAPRHHLKEPQQIKMLGKSADRNARKDNESDDEEQVFNPQRTFSDAKKASKITPIGHTDSAYAWPAGFEPAAGDATAQCENDIFASPGDTIEYYGDSTIYGFVPGSKGARVSKPATASFAEALDDQYVVRNEAVNSGTACDLLNGTDKKHPAWASQMRGSDARIVILSFALNDQWVTKDVEKYAQCLRNLSKIAKENGKQVIFETPNPDGYKGALPAYVNAMRKVAAEEGDPVIDQYKFLMDYLGGGDVKTIVPDLRHPSDAVYDMKGKFAASVFGELTSGCESN